MRKKIFRLLFALWITSLGTVVFAQTAVQIKKIRAEVNLINQNAATFKKAVRNVENIALEGTEATYFVSGRQLKKATAKMFGETFNASVELYFADEKLIFAFLKENRYDGQIGTKPPPKIIKSEEKRFYFADGKPIRLLVGKTEIKAGAENYRELTEQIEDIAGKIKAAY